jgi:para-nitrobenzyl esterase
MSTLRVEAGGETPVCVGGGWLAGTRDPKTGLRAWLGVPFAAPPVGALRWRPPAPVAAWEGVRKAERFAPQCLQPGRAEDSVYAEFAGVQPMSEDCLYLNVWSPSEAGDAPLPVMVWIHGGAFQQGSAANPVFVRGDLARRGVVLVTLNYRLGPFGFLAHPELGAESGQGTSGNYGLMDMAAALRWVQHNIAAFGGDPAQVTVFGQSAGAHGVIALMASPEARGLFRHAIAQSFGIARTESLAKGEERGARFVQGIGPGTHTIESLRAMAAGELLAHYLAQPARFMPIADGQFLRRPLVETFARGEQQHVPLLTGWNRDEGTTFPPALGPIFAAGVHAAARMHASVAPTFLYHFAHMQPFKPGQRYREADPATRLGVFHSSEYPYIFGTTGELTRDWGEDDARMTQLMQGYWTRFARTGSPNGADLPHWPLFREGHPTVMQLQPKPVPVDVPPHAPFSLEA